MYSYVLRSKGGNFLCLRSFQGEPQYFLSTGIADANHYPTWRAALDACVLGAEALGLKITFTVLTVETVQGGEA